MGYLIERGHVLSGNSFNSLLKTVEEPPPHVKFLLATADPQRLPVTVLSRCLQFSLKALPAEQIAGHLKALLERGMIRFEEPALLALVAPGAVWVAALLAVMLSLDGLFRRDQESGALDLLLTAPVVSVVPVAAKLLAHWLLTGLPLALIAPLLG